MGARRRTEADADGSDRLVPGGGRPALAADGARWGPTIGRDRHGIVTLCPGIWRVRHGTVTSRGYTSLVHRSDVPSTPADPRSQTPDPVVMRPSSRGGLASSQRRRWSRRAVSWDREAGANPGLTRVVAAVVADARVLPGMRVADLGCGTGQVAFPLARMGADVSAVDISEAMIGLLRANAAHEGVHGVSGIVSDLERLSFPVASLDVVVSSYALHHLADAEKRRLVERAADWLRPGGRIVIGDMMFGRGADAHDRAIIREKAAALLRKGPGGYWRLAKGAWRFGARTSERPLPPAAWVQLLEDAGFEDVAARRVVSEAWIVSGVAPAAAPR